MKKILCIFLINILLLIIIVISFEYYCGYKNFYKQGILKGSFKDKIKRTNELYLIRYDSCKNQRYSQKVRSFKYDKSLEKENIILIGCSYTYGDGLNEEESLGVKLSKHTNRNVLNLGMCCGSPKESLHILQNKKIRHSLLKYVYKDAEYVIFTYIFDHKRRLYYDVCDFYYLPSYKYNKKEDKLIYYDQNNIIKSSFFINYLRNFYFENIIKKQNKDFELIRIYFREINKEIIKNFKTKSGVPAQFVILVYDEDGREDWASLEKEGIKIIKIENLVGKYITYNEYRTPDWHPAAEAWDKIIPLLSKELNL